MDILQLVEATAVALNIVYVVLAVKEKVWCWPFGIAASLISIWFFIEIKLFAEAILFTYYVLMGFYGWWAWSRKNDEVKNIQVLKFVRHSAIIASGIALALLLGYALSTRTVAESPYFDSFTTIFSFVATWLTARKVLENWVYWIVVDLATIFLYASKGADLYAGLSVVYTVMAAYGLWQWTRSYRLQQT